MKEKKDYLYHVDFCGADCGFFATEQEARYFVEQEWNRLTSQQKKSTETIVEISKFKDAETVEKYLNGDWEDFARDFEGVYEVILTEGDLRI